MNSEEVTKIIERLEHKASLNYNKNADLLKAKHEGYIQACGDIVTELLLTDNKTGGVIFCKRSLNEVAKKHKC